MRTTICGGDVGRHHLLNPRWYSPPPEGFMPISDLSIPPIENAAAPISPEERLLTLDVLRGLALLGVLVANVWFWFSGLFLRMAEFRPELERLTPDSAAFHLISVFVSGKAMAIFSFLFGVGLAVQAMRAERRGAD